MNPPHTHTIALSRKQKQCLVEITHKGTHKARVVRRARVLLKSAQGKTNDEIARDEGVYTTTIDRICSRFDVGGLDRALYDAPRPGQPKKLTERAEAHLIALACSDPPEGADHWTLELLQQQMIKDKKTQEISTVALWHRLNAHALKPWREKNVVYSDTHGGVH